MAINRSIRQRPIKNINRETLANPDEMERHHRWIGDAIDQLDRRRIAQQTAVEEGATDADTIQNLLTAINNLFALLNASSLTED